MERFQPQKNGASKGISQGWSTVTYSAALAPPGMRPSLPRGNFLQPRVHASAHSGVNVQCGAGLLLGKKTPEIPDNAHGQWIRRKQQFLIVRRENDISHDEAMPLTRFGSILIGLFARLIHTPMWAGSLEIRQLQAYHSTNNLYYSSGESFTRLRILTRRILPLKNIISTKDYNST